MWPSLYLAFLPGMTVSHLVLDSCMVFDWILLHYCAYYKPALIPLLIFQCSMPAYFRHTNTHIHTKWLNVITPKYKLNLSPIIRTLFPCGLTDTPCRLPTPTFELTHTLTHKLVLWSAIGSLHEPKIPWHKVFGSTPASDQCPWRATRRPLHLNNYMVSYAGESAILSVRHRQPTWLHLSLSVPKRHRGNQLHLLTSCSR